MMSAPGIQVTSEKWRHRGEAIADMSQPWQGRCELPDLADAVEHIFDS